MDTRAAGKFNSIHTHTHTYILYIHTCIVYIYTHIYSLYIYIYIFYKYVKILGLPRWHQWHCRIHKRYKSYPWVGKIS